MSSLPSFVEKADGICLLSPYVRQCWPICGGHDHGILSLAFRFRLAVRSSMSGSSELLFRSSASAVIVFAYRVRMYVFHAVSVLPCGLDASTDVYYSRWRHLYFVKRKIQRAKCDTETLQHCPNQVFIRDSKGYFMPHGYMTSYSVSSID